MWTILFSPLIIFRYLFDEIPKDVSKLCGMSKRKTGWSSLNNNSIYRKKSDGFGEDYIHCTKCNTKWYRKSLEDLMENGCPKCHLIK